MRKSIIAASFLAALLSVSTGTTLYAQGRDSDLNRDDTAIDRDGTRVTRDSDRNGRQAMNTRDDRREDRADAEQILRDSSEVYRAIAKGPHGGVPETVTSKAQCIAIVPSVITAAAVIGGTHGDGVATCKTFSGKWSDPLFADLNAGSLGAQIGAKSTDVVMYFTSPAAVAALKRGKFALGADASVVAGNFDRSFDTSGAGVVAYQRASGAFLGAAINGGSLALDKDENFAYYGKDISAADVLEGRQMAMNGKINPLSGLLP